MAPQTLFVTLLAFATVASALFCIFSFLVGMSISWLLSAVFQSCADRLPRA